MLTRSILPIGPIVVLVLTISTGPAAPEDEEQIHACRDGNGEIVYQSDPCAEQPPTTPSVPAAPPAEPARAPAPSRPAPSPARRDKSGAARGEVRPGPGTAPRRPRPTFILVPPSLRSDPAQPGGGPARTPVRSGAGPLDPRFASPEKTWQTFRAAVGVNDLETALRCLAPSVVERLGPRIDSPGAAAMGWIVDESARVHAEGEAGPYWSLRIARAHERPRWVFLVRTDSGEWKIAAL